MTGCSNGSNAGEDSCRSGIRGIAGADVGRGDDGVDAGARAGGRGRDAADAPVRDRAAQDHRVQKIVASEVVDELAAAAQEAKILDAFDRAADKGIACALLLHRYRCPSQS